MRRMRINGYTRKRVGVLHVQMMFRLRDIAKNVRAHGASVEMNKFPSPAKSSR
jgi:hypothetical protein